jgi:hypothetical protein
MSLAEHFEPLEPPENGLRVVRKRARRRAVSSRLARGGALMFLPVLFISGAFLVGGNTDTDDVSFPSTTHITDPHNDSDTTGVNISNGSTEITNIRPDATGLPGSSVSTTAVKGTVFFSIPIVLIIAMTVLISVMRARRATVPLDHFSLIERGILVACTAVSACTFIAIWLTH